MKALTFLLSLSLLAGCGQTSPLLASRAPRSLNSLSAQVAGQRRAAPVADLGPYFSTALLRIPQAAGIPAALAALTRLQAQTRLEAGNRAFVVHQDQNDPQTILIWEAFASEADFQQHLASRHLQDFLATQTLSFVKGYAATRPEAALAASPQGYFSTALLSLQPGQSRAEAEQALAALEARTRLEAGNRAFVVQSLISEGQPLFVIWEQFESKAAFEAHLASPHLQAFLARKLVKLDRAYTLQPIAAR